MTRLAEGIRKGERRALAKALTLVESGAPEAEEVLRALGAHSVRADVVGVTGAPGVGKSTLVDRLARVFANRGRQVGVLAVDPSSPFSGGALLGDRIRMDDPDPRVFIRSLATRGHLGGVARAIGPAMALMEAFGKDLILVETVGAGQSEVEIMGHADLTVVVVVPGLGDDIQANKAGILEIGDLFVVNKADRPGADLVMRELRAMLSLGPKKEARPEVLKTVASADEGVEALADRLTDLLASPETARRKERRRLGEAERRLREAVTRRVLEALGDGARGEAWRRAVQAIASGASDADREAQGMLHALGLSKGGFGL